MKLYLDSQASCLTRCLIIYALFAVRDFNLHLVEDISGLTRGKKPKIMGTNSVLASQFSSKEKNYYYFVWIINQQGFSIFKAKNVDSFHMFSYSVWTAILQNCCTFKQIYAHFWQCGGTFEDSDRQFISFFHLIPFFKYVFGWLILLHYLSDCSMTPKKGSRPRRLWDTRTSSVWERAFTPYQTVSHFVIFLDCTTFLKCSLESLHDV